MNTTDGNQRYARLRTLAWTLISGPVLFAVVIYFLVGLDDGGMDSPAVWVLIVQVALAATLYFAVEAIGFQTDPAKPGDPQEVANTSFMTFQTALVLRFALCESLTIISIALAFVVTPYTFLTYALGGLLSVVLMLLFVLPNERSVRRIQSALERDGSPSYLREALGLNG